MPRGWRCAEASPSGNTEWGVSISTMHVAVDIGSDRVTAATGRPSLREPGRTLRLGHSSDAASSAVFVVEDGFVHGDAAARRAVAGPDRVLRDYPERIGDAVPLTVARRSVRAEDAYAGVAEWVFGAAVDALGTDPDALTAVLPAGWGPHRRARLRAAMDARGLPARFLSAPEAAARHRMIVTGRDDDLFALYDLGASSCDLAVVRIRSGVSEVLAATTLDTIGGADFDDIVYRHILGHLPGGRAAGPLALGALRRECTAAKEALSFDTETVIPVTIGGAEHLVRLVRDEFESLIETDIRTTVTALEDLCADAGVLLPQLSGVLLAGGGGRIPRVMQLLSEMLGVAVDADADPQTILARGAAAGPVPAADDTSQPDAEGAAESAPIPGAPAAPGRVRRLLDAVMRSLLPPPAPDAASAAGFPAAAETPDGTRGALPPAPAPVPIVSEAPSGPLDEPQTVASAQTSPPPSSPSPIAKAPSRRRTRAGV